MSCKIQEKAGDKVENKRAESGKKGSRQVWQRQRRDYLLMQD